LGSMNRFTLSSFGLAFGLKKERKEGELTLGGWEKAFSLETLLAPLLTDCWVVECETVE